MAGDWLKMNFDLPEHRCTLYVAATTGLNVDDVVGKFFRVWRWVQTQTPNGTVRPADVTMVDRLVQFEGFARAMAACGWLEIGDGFLRFPRWNSHNSSNAKKRAIDNQRQARNRSAKCHAASVTKTGPEQSRAEQIREREDKQGKAGSAPPVVLEGDMLRLALLDAGVPEGEVWGLMTHEKASNANLSHAAARMYEAKKQGKVIKHPVKYAMRIAWGEPNTREKWAGKAKDQFDAARLRLANGGAA